MFLIGTFFADAAPKDALDDIDFFQFPIIDPTVPVAEEAPDRRLLRQRPKPKRTGRVKDLLTYLATAEAQEIYVKSSSGTALPTNPDAKDAGTPLVKKGTRARSRAPPRLTQFFNRDSSDALQPTADTALTKFLAKPKQIGSILTDWQRERRRRSARPDVTARRRAAPGRPHPAAAHGRPDASPPPLVLAFVLVPLLAEALLGLLARPPGLLPLAHRAGTACRRPSSSASATSARWRTTRSSAPR